MSLGFYSLTLVIAWAESESYSKLILLLEDLNNDLEFEERLPNALLLRAVGKVGADYFLFNKLMFYTEGASLSFFSLPREFF